MESFVRYYIYTVNKTIDNSSPFIAAYLPTAENFTCTVCYYKSSFNIGLMQKNHIYFISENLQ